MRGRGIGTARGRATIMRGLSFLFLHFCALLTEQIALFLLLWMIFIVISQWCGTKSPYCLSLL